MPDLRRFPPDRWAESDTERLRRLAEIQHGVVSRRQLHNAGLGGGAISRWVDAGRLYRIHPHVYALGHRALSINGRLIASLLYAGPDAALSHTTAAWVWSLSEAEPTRIHLTAPAPRRSLPGVRLHRSRLMEVTETKGLRVTTPARTLLDLATVTSSRQLRRAIAEADFRGHLNLADVESVLGRGRPGSRALRAALASHLPELAETFSALEERFLELCEAARLPQPEVNARVSRMRVDALWRDRGIAVELDGAAAHGGWSSIERDRRRELALRAKGLQVVRYTWEQVTRRPNEVANDLRNLLRI